mmetsp:Transcript_24332/g.31768  ORF Transcript_24332/g.31768 Transcript_24332/m.31768 type:complete len:213 (-) Transcript_24332:190-828(-)
MMNVLLHLFKVLLAFAFALYAGEAHISATEPTGYSGSYHMSRFRVPHGCDGQHTLNTTFVIPEGVYSVKAEQMPGYEVLTTTRILDPPVIMHGQAVNETMHSVTYVGILPHDQFREFGLSMKLPTVTETTVLPFVAYQHCASAVLSWDDSGDRPSPKITVLVDDAQDETTDETTEDFASSSYRTTTNLPLYYGLAALWTMKYVSSFRLFSII